jgi:hypothetical protein
MRRLLGRLRTDPHELHLESLRTQFDALDVTPIADAPARRPVRIVGEVQSVQVVPRPGAPWLEARLGDGTGEVIVAFPGRRRLGGFDPGRSVIVEGVAHLRGRRLVILNPAYTLLV